MSRIEDFAFNDVMAEAVRLFGHDTNMENCKDLEELTENIGQESIDMIVQALDEN